MLVSLVLDDDGGSEDTLAAIYQVGPHTVQIKQRPNESRSLLPTENSSSSVPVDNAAGVSETQGAPLSSAVDCTAAAPSEADNSPSSDDQGHQTTRPDPAASETSTSPGACDWKLINRARSVAFSQLANVGWTVWQSAFILGEWLLRKPPVASWQGVKVLELGAGTGVLGLVLAMAGADVTLTDLEHVTPLCRENVEANRDALCGRVEVKDYKFGAPVAELSDGDDASSSWDLIVAADTLYWSEFHEDLLKSLQNLCGPSSHIYLGYRVRSGEELGFEAKAAAKEFSIEATPSEELDAEYQGDGRYRIVRLTRSN